MVHSFPMDHCNGSEQWFSVERRPRKKERKEAGLLGGFMMGLRCLLGGESSPMSLSRGQKAQALSWHHG